MHKGADAEATARAIATRWDGARITLEVPGEEPLVSTRRGLGAHLDEARLAALLRDANDSTSGLRRAHARLAPGRPLEVPLPIVLDERAVFEHLADLKDGYDRRPSDARAGVRTGEVVPHRHGRLLDVHATLDALRSALERGLPACAPSSARGPRIARRRTWTASTRARCSARTRRGTTRWKRRAIGPSTCASPPRRSTGWWSCPARPSTSTMRSASGARPTASGPPR
ncbi:MAG: peptidoglycan binding domain-containing protein [Sandaracinaceae bacterium]|nr:peptidoglycan binding domain-containing protein [Sandaracinaceae bacterium]